MATLMMCVLVCGGVGMALGYFQKGSAAPLVANCGRGALYGAALGLAFYFVSGVGGSAAMNQSTSNVKHITEKDFDADVIRSTKPVVADFYATWCGPCKILSPELDKLAGSFTNEIKFVKVNVDEAPNLSQRFNIQGYPTLLFFKNGKVVDDILGLVSSDVLKARLASFAGTHVPVPSNFQTDSKLAP